MGFLDGLIGKKKEKDYLWKYGAGSSIFTISFSTSEYTTAVGLVNGKVFAIDAQGELLFHRKIGEEYSRVCISSDGSHIAVGSGKTLYLLNKSGELIISHEVVGTITNISTSSDGLFTSVGTKAGMIYLISKSGEILWSRKTDNESIRVSVSPDGSVIASSLVSKIGLFHQSGDMLWEQAVNSIAIMNISFSPDGAVIALGCNKTYSGGDSCIYLFNTGGKLLWYHEKELNCFGAYPSTKGDYVASTFTIPEEGGKGQLCIFDQFGKELWSCENWGHGISITEDASLIATCFSTISDDPECRRHPKLRLHNHNGQNLWNYNSNSWIEKICLSNNGAYLVASTNNELIFFQTSNLLNAK